MNLKDSLESSFRLSLPHKRALEKVGLKTIEDLLYYFPQRYSDQSTVKLIRDLEDGETATIYGEITNLKTKKSFRSKVPMAEGVLNDGSGKIKVVWFNQAFVGKVLHNEQKITLTGKVSTSKYGLSITNPEYESCKGLPVDVHDSLFAGTKNEQDFSFPIYRETKGLTSKWIYHAINKIVSFGALKNLEEYIPEDILKKYNLPKLQTALVWIHMPRNKKDAEAARKRFAFEEVFFIQLEKQKEREENREKKSFKIFSREKEINDFVKRFPFEMTLGQKSAVSDILDDFEKDYPMSRLLEGDVGSGKTAVAATASYATITNRPDGKTFGNLQVAYMAPTEILAGQHFESFIKYFTYTGINIGLITGSGCKKFPSKINPNGWTDISKSQLLKWVENGEIPILIGTHALIYKSVKFKHLALAIVDEQHRFGTKQRSKLAKKDEFAPHFLSMTATPIPRTLALTIYGDLDLTLLEEMPAGRKKVITEIIRPDKRDETYEFIKSQMNEGRQLYVICPRINEPDPDKEFALQAKSVKAEAKRLKENIFKDKNIGILHSKMTPAEKERVMQDFSDKKIDILCATSVVEVGVNVPNATLIIIEGAERFGLAQLHQLRGRVIRSNHQAYCFVFPETESKKSLDRLKALKTAKNGFELSELDLGLRGSGDLAGMKQWGVTDLGMEAIKNLKMVEAARNEARDIVTKNKLEKFPALLAEFLRREKKIHFE
ncbi:MAG: ATP-dependent DNA helicase RecG [Bacteroidetes bacterium]|nr:ATP-dependent DNA helicase RecG [Bacteroidota bacterium]